jgi:hypothetical protein
MASFGHGLTRMAQLSLGEGRWRMLRRVLKKRRFRYADCRNMTRLDQTHFDWLVENGFFTVAGDGVFEVTERGRVSADLGEYEWEPGAAPTPPARKRVTARTAR